MALGITLAGVALLWFAAVAPLLDWQQDQTERLSRQRMIVARLDRIAATLPALQRQAAALPAKPSAAPLDGATDALAAAALQEKLDDLADDAGVHFASTEALPAEPSGREYRAVKLRVTLSAQWDAIVTLLHAAAASSTPLIVEDLTLRGAGRGTAGPLDATFTVTGLRRADSAQ